MGREIKFTEEQISYIVESYVDNYESFKTISKKYNVDPSVISRILTKQGIKIAKGSAYTSEYWVSRGMLEEDAKYKVKTLRPLNVEYWLVKGYNLDEAKLKVKATNLLTLDGYVERYGEVEGKIKWDLKKNKLLEYSKLSNTRKEYWLKKGFTVEEAINKISDRQKTFSLKICIEKYGETNGLKIFNDRQFRWMESLNKNGNLKVGHSKISQDLFNEILLKFPNEDWDDIKFGTHNGEIILKNGECSRSYDYCDVVRRKIIEFHGDLFHGNPKKFKPNDNPNPFNKNILAKDLWANDKLKLELANEKGYDVLIIWDSEYRWGCKEKIIDKCIKFLKDE